MSTESECIREMQSSHAAAAVSASFDDTNLVAYAGLVPVMRLAERCGLSRLAAAKVKLSRAKNSAGAAADAKITGFVAVRCGNQGVGESLGRPLVRSAQCFGRFQIYLVGHAVADEKDQRNGLRDLHLPTCVLRRLRKTEISRC